VWYRVDICSVVYDSLAGMSVFSVVDWYISLGGGEATASGCGAAHSRTA
jgi:hypothetical protein